MQKFPVLKPNQVALARAEFNTGHALDENLNLALRDSQIVYTIFNNLEDALATAEGIVKNGLVECLIFGKDQGLIKHVTPENA